MKLIVQQKRHTQEIAKLQAHIDAQAAMEQWDRWAPAFHDPLFGLAVRKQVFDAMRTITKGGIR